jgi:hypothetical protein
MKGLLALNQRNRRREIANSSRGRSFIASKQICRKSICNLNFTPNSQPSSPSCFLFPVSLLHFVSFLWFIDGGNGGTHSSRIRSNRRVWIRIEKTDRVGEHAGARDPKGEYDAQKHHGVRDGCAITALLENTKTKRSYVCECQVMKVVRQDGRGEMKPNRTFER